MEIRPITFKAACEFVSLHHRHHKPTIGCKFCVGLYEGETLIGCAICGRPVSRHLDNGLTCEINRLCVMEGYYTMPVQCFTERVAVLQKQWGTSISSLTFLSLKTVHLLKQVILSVRV